MTRPAPRDDRPRPAPDGRARRAASTPRDPARRPRWGRWIALAVAVVVLGALAWLAFGSRIVDVTDVRVLGAAPETTADVQRAAAVTPGTSLLWLDGDEVADRVRELPRVATVDVARDWPSTVVVTVSEREPAVAVPAPGGVALVDPTGFAYRTAGGPPAGVPLLSLPPGVAPSPDQLATRSAAEVVTALPASLRRDVTEVRATGPYDVTLVLAGGREVRWGADADNPRKAAVLAALLTRPGQTYDVSSPDLAVVR